ncbi:hypothetical protein QYS49_07255 [Marivirga salinae]|uniref:Uncharacterized protein n=1 Tax=Marivirga salinarum TaxID=3059078 RepID=A0AA49GCW3_9BACT|nr:hypothetical protein [Marivirga sp. BDSF4-3]WKK77019.2 hypothetical protein QYS49_07255 [Marivirga sp. BDSF4-3]
MENLNSEVIYLKFKHDMAEVVSSSANSAKNFLIEEGLDYDSLINSALSQIKEKTKKVNKNADLSKGQLYFRRVVLAGEIAKQLHGEITFGHVKFQKLMFLSEKICKYNLKHRYLKQAAGPMDNKFMHSIDREFKKQKWFEVKRVGAHNKFVYNPLPGLKKQENFYKSYYSTNHHKIQWLIDSFRSSRTHKVELVATLFACWEDLKDENVIINENTLTNKLYQWSKEKSKYRSEEIQGAIKWMEENNLKPESLY